MATIMKRVFTTGHLIFLRVCYRESFAVKHARHIYSDEFLGLDKHMAQRQRVSAQFIGMKEKYFERMNSVVHQEGQAPVFSEDLKNVVHMAEDNPEDIELCIRMMLKFHKQNKEMRFGTFVFGPVIMRWLYLLKKPDFALECLKNEELCGFFDQPISYLMIMNLLYKQERYTECLNIFYLLQEKNLHGTRFHKDPIVLALGACYKLNTPESFQMAEKIIKTARDSGLTIPRRGITFSSTLALRQNDAKAALEILSISPYTNYITVRNLKIQILARLDRVEDIFPILRLVIDRDLPRSSRPSNSFDTKEICQETVECIQQAVDRSKDKEMVHIFEQICRALKENDHITTETIDTLHSRVVQPKLSPRGERDWYNEPGSTSRPYRNFNLYRGSRDSGNRKQPGLIDRDEE